MARIRKLAERTFKPNKNEGLIETRAATPTVPIFLHYKERENFTEYELTHSLRGRRILKVIVPTCRWTHA